MANLTRYNPFNEVIIATLYFHIISGLTREDTNLLVCLLTRDTVVNEPDDNILGGHEWKFLHKL